MNTSLFYQLSQLVHLAGGSILEIYNSGNLGIITKEDNSPLTQADCVSNKILLDGLYRILDCPVLSEETPVNYEIRRNWQKFWLVDPLDGTKDFIAGNGMFTVNIALIEDGLPILGIIYLPATDTTYYAEKGRGASRNGKRIYNNSTRSGKDLIAADSMFHSTQDTREFLRKNGITRIKRYGSSLKYGKLAEGEIDLYPRLNGTKEWDTAAGQIILEEAGCMMVAMTTSKPLKYNKPDIKNCFFLAMRNNLKLKWI
jgi:3'(2'), 5'-bisphosphate nucleotidase